MEIIGGKSPYFPNILDIFPSVARKLHKRKEVVIVDIREPWEYQEHHIPGSVLIPLGYFDFLFPKFIESTQIGSVAVICEHANRSTFLVYSKPYLFNGLKAYNVIGGMELWIRMGYEVEKGIDDNGKLWSKLLKDTKK